MNWLKGFLPTQEQLPTGWSAFDRRDDGAAYGIGTLTIISDDWKSNQPAFLKRLPGLGVILTGAEELDGRRWLHMAVSHPRNRPSHEDMLLAKAIFIGYDKLAFELYPSAQEDVRLPYSTRYIFHCIDGQPMPTFRTVLNTASINFGMDPVIEKVVDAIATAKAEGQKIRAEKGDEKIIEVVAK